MNGEPAGGTGSTATAHARAAYLPEPAPQRSGIALCLSGGGYRAALFDLGACRRLNELGVLSQVDTITSVSGGSIFSAFLALHLVERDRRWPEPGEVLADWEEGVGRPLRALTRTNVRTRVFLLRLHPRTWLHRSVPIELLAESYEKGIRPIPFGALPERPRFIVCATDMEFGAQWVLDSGRRSAGSDPVGYAHPVPDTWTLTRAVAASSTVPGAFPPLRAVADPELHAGGSYEGSDRAERLRGLVLSDGGVYDNLGVEPVWRDHRVVLVSDAAPTYASLWARPWIWRGIRYPTLLLDQATEVRKRWLISSFIRGDLEGAYWGMGSLPGHYDGAVRPTAYPDDVIVRLISRIRIDLDRFSEGEIAVLENHGYLMADLAVQRHAPHLIRRPAPLAVPHEDWLDEERVRRALARSHRMSIIGRGFPR